MPSSDRTASTRSLTAVSGSHMPSGDRPKRWRKSAIPHRTWVRRSRSEHSGRMAWPYPWAMARPVRRSAPMNRSYTSGRCSSSQDRSVGPTL
jgi:hypothetical protein